MYYASHFRALKYDIEMKRELCLGASTEMYENERNHELYTEALVE